MFRRRFVRLFCSMRCAILCSVFMKVCCLGFVFYLFSLFHQPSARTEVYEQIVPVPIRFRHSGILPYELQGLSSSQWMSHPVLKRALSPKKYAHVTWLLGAFVRLMDQNDVQVVLAANTLLGSYFFHDLVPWSSDVDVMVNYADRHKIFRLLAQRDVRSVYGVTGHGGREDWYTMDKLLYSKEFADRSDIQFTFYKLDVTTIRSASWDRLFITIQFYKVVFDQVILFHTQRRDTIQATNTNTTTTTATTTTTTVSVNVFFPLKKRPLGDNWFLAPADTRTFLRIAFGRFVCKRHQQSYGTKWHPIHRPSPPPPMAPCAEMLMYYPCVRRTWVHRRSTVASEMLIFRGEAVHMVKVTEPYHAVTGCYDLASGLDP